MPEALHLKAARQLAAETAVARPPGALAQLSDLERAHDGPIPPEQLARLPGVRLSMLRAELRFATDMARKQVTICRVRRAHKAPMSYLLSDLALYNRMRRKAKAAVAAEERFVAAYAEQAEKPQTDLRALHGALTSGDTATAAGIIFGGGAR